MLDFLDGKKERGSNRGTVEDTRAVDTEKSRTQGGQRQAGEAQRPSRVQRHPLGAADGRGVGGLARTLSLELNLPQEILVLGKDGSAAAHPRGDGAASGGRRRDRSFRVLHRRHVRRCQKGGSKVGKTKRGKGTKLMAIADASGLPLAVHTASASPHEVTLVEATLDEVVTVGRPERLVGDRAYDSDPLDERLAQRGVELIAPHRSNRSRRATQDGRSLRRYRRRWKVERLFAWLNKYKRVLTRWDRSAEHYTAFVHLAFSMILLNRHL